MFTKPMNPRTVEDVIMDFKGRRAAIIKALTKDVEEFYQGCDPSYPNLCLYGYPNRRWEVNLPPPDSDLPEPRLGINFSRDVMKREDWLSMVALHSESWLHGMASYFGAKFNFDKFERKRLFSKIVEFPSICEVLSGEPARRKRVRFENCGLPEEMLIEVLTRVPVKDLIRYRSVSKRWRSIIDDSGFVGKHLSSYKSNLEGSHLLVMEVPRSYFKDVRVLVRSSDMFRKATTVDRLDVGKNSSFLSYINGVMLVRSGYHLLLWNPSINRSLNLPDSILQFTRDAAYYELGLGFDASNNDYKVIAIVYPQAEMKHHCGNKRFRATVPGLVQVYTLSTKAWTGLIDLEPPTYWSSGSQAFINGAIHWTSLGPNTRDDSWHTMRDSHIVSFDVTNEVFRYFELPSGLKDCDHDQTVVLKENKLLVMDGSLAMFRSYESHNDIWVMKEYGVPESWSKLYTFALKMDWNNLVYLKSNGELLYAMEGKGVLAYDIKKKRVRDVAKTYNKTSKYIVYTYVQSLVLSSIIFSKPPEIIGAGGQNDSVFTTT